MTGIIKPQPAGVRGLLSVSAAAAVLFVNLLVLLFTSTAFGAFRVDNIAGGSYTFGTLPMVTDSNLVSMVVRTPSTIDFLEYAPLNEAAELVNVPTTEYLTDGVFVPMAWPVPLGTTTPLDLSNPLPLVDTLVYHEKEPVFIRLTDPDQNLDPLQPETVQVTLTSNGDTEVLILTETGPDTGVFTGYIQSTTGGSVPGNGVITVNQNSSVEVTYTDPVDGTDTSAAAVLIDPFGIFFDTSTGQPVDGAVISLVNIATGLPATVFGDDGVSTYPSTLTAGGTATDSSGRTYSFPPGGYRFPYVPPGDYRFDVVPPGTYIAPSVVDTAVIQSLPSAPFSITVGSRGENFVINPGPALHIDIPLDPLATNLYVRKEASKEQVAIGDFLQYRIEVENTTAAVAPGVVTTDRLPLGFRYRSGSAKLDGVPLAEPLISADGRSLVFSIGSIGASSSAVITYVVEVSAGARLGEAENTAVAVGGAFSSNTASAVVVVKEDLFRQKAIIVGRVFPEGCDEFEDGQENDGVAGVRIYLEDGTYVITDRMGMYHFEGVDPGTHVVQLDYETLPEDRQLVDCEKNDRFGGRAYSQFVDIQGGTLWRANFYTSPKPLPPPVMLNGPVGIELSSDLENGQPENASLQYAVDMNVGEVAVANLRLTVMLPEGVAYRPGSSTFGGEPLPDPEGMGNVLTYRLGDGEAGWRGQVRFAANLAADVKERPLTTKALLTFDTADAKNMRTPLAENILEHKTEEERQKYPDIILRPHFEEFGFTLHEEDKGILDGIIADLKKVSVTQIFVAGHTDSTPISPRSREIMADNHALSRARAKAVAEYLAAGLDMTPDQITITGKGPDQPVASNATAEGRSLNRRVELRVVSERVITRTELKNVKEKSGRQEIVIEAVKVAEKSAAEKAMEEMVRARTMPEFDQAWLRTVKPGLELLWPAAGYYPAMPSVKVAVKHDPAKEIHLFLNKEEVDPIYFDETIKGNDKRVAVSHWMGVHVNEGDNLFEVVEYGLDGTAENRQERTIHYSRPPVKVVLVPEYSRLIADGHQPPVITVRLTDQDGHPARRGLIGEYHVEPPHLPLQMRDELEYDPLTRSRNENLTYVVGEDGIALIKLQPTSQTGEAAIQFKLMNGEQEINSWLTPGERDWILVGLAEGTVGYNSISGNMESFGDSGNDENYYEDGRVVFFAKGLIKGKWLLTAAYDSNKDGIRENGSLYGTIDPNTYYTLYGDGSAQQYDAASARKLYLKIERDNFYALFGDFSTGLTVTELSAYSRSLNGLKTEMRGEKYDFNLFASDTNQAFVKDEIRGDGTSGLYRLSRKNIVMNSESITIEARDRFKSEVIISSNTLSRHIDYDIDYEAGTVFFKTPVFSRDENFNPVYIVVNYESYDRSADLSFNYGGRGAARFLDNKLEIGASHIHEGRVGGEGDLVGVDANLKLTDETTVRLEVAATDTDFNGMGQDGTAYIAEISHSSVTVEGRAYLREQESAFGLGQQMGSESGTRKAGVAGSYQLNEKIRLMGDVSRQYNLATEAVRDLAEARATYGGEGYSLQAGIRHAKDELGNGEVNNAEQLTLGGSMNLLGDSLVVRADHDQSLASSSDLGDYPTRTTLGADYKLNETASLFVNQEFSVGELENTQTTRFGVKASPWEGGNVSSTLERQYTENGARVFSVLGLQQGWQINDKWRVDGGLDRSYTFMNPGSTPFNVNVPPASGNSTDFTAVSVGAAYDEEKWSWTGRLETRISDNEDKVGISTGIYREVNEGLGLSAGLQVFISDSMAGLQTTNGNLSLGLAYRPKVSKWIVFDKLAFLVDRQEGGDFDIDNWRIINNTHVNYWADEKTQLSLQYGAKYVHETIDGSDYSGFTDLMGFEARYDLTKRFDIGVFGSALHSWNSGVFDYGAGLSVGCNLLKNAWISLGYNIAGIEDDDFSNGGFTARGPFIRFRFKVDQKTPHDVLQFMRAVTE